LIFGELGISALWSNWVVLLKTILLFVLTGFLSVVTFSIQPKIEVILDKVNPENPAPPDLAGQLKPHRAKRKQLATGCLFLVISCIILGLQVEETFNSILSLHL